VRFHADLKFGELLSGVGVVKADRVVPFVHDDHHLLSIGGRAEKEKEERRCDEYFHFHADTLPEIRRQRKRRRANFYRFQLIHARLSRHITQQGESA
jgi:hypothetical protein